MIIIPQHIFSDFKNKVLNPDYFPKDPLETLKARLTATWLLQASDTDITSEAKAFILKTSTQKEQDLLRLEQLALQVKHWDRLEICSAYTNSAGTFLEYKLSFITKDEHKQTLHLHANYKTHDQSCCFISQTTPLIRVTGDPILQKPGILFPEQATLEQQQELSKQIEHAKSVLIQTGGAGIAANQCAAIEKPYQFTILGVFHDIHAHAIAVEERYPGTKFPQAIIMVNPVITSISEETQKFNHACLSVPCSNRCTVQSPKEMSVSYLDPLDKMKPKHVTLCDIDAVVLWHELTHIIHGKTYMDVTFDALSKEDLQEFKNMLDSEIHRRHTVVYTEIPVLSVPPFHFSVKINTNGIAQLDAVELAKALPNMTNETLSGLLHQANILLKKKLS